MNLETVRGLSYEKLGANYDALQTLDEHTKLDGFVMVPSTNYLKLNLIWLGLMRSGKKGTWRN